MQKLLLLINLFLISTSFEASANRSMYVDGFETILGNTSAENTLLNYAQSHGIETLLLYGLHIVNANHDLPNPATNFVLADFIYKAKNSYGILYIAATAENGDFFTNVIDPYNNSRSDPLEKFDIYNLEFEYWIGSSTGPGGYYCTTYLTPNGHPCNENGAFQFYISILETMNTLASNNSHPITTEAYVGWTTVGQADTIGANLDRLRLHAYVSDPNTSFNYSEDRLMDFANGTPGLNVSIIFSSEPTFMQNWLDNNSMISAENIYTTDWMNGSSGWPNNINLEGFTYFTYTDMTNVPLPVELAYFGGQAIDLGIRLNWGTLSETNSDYFEIERKNMNTFQPIGSIKSSESNTSGSQYQFIDPNPNRGENYYRLKQIDYDGKFHYSNIINIPYLSDRKSTKIYPSFVKDFISIESNKKIDQILIYDTNGRKIKEFSDIDPIIAKINIADLFSGVYLLILKSDSKIESFRFIKQN